jgi:hypothetical protein
MNFFKRLIHKLIMKTPPEDWAGTTTTTTSTTVVIPPRPTVPVPSNQDRYIGHYFKHKSYAGDIIYIHSKVGHGYEKLDPEQLVILNQLSDGRIVDDIRQCKPLGDDDQNHFRHYPRTIMPLIHPEDIDGNYNKVDFTDPASGPESREGQFKMAVEATLENFHNRRATLLNIEMNHIEERRLAQFNNAVNNSVTANYTASYAEAARRRREAEAQAIVNAQYNNLNNSIDGLNLSMYNLGDGLAAAANSVRRRNNQINSARIPDNRPTTSEPEDPPKSDGSIYIAIDPTPEINKDSDPEPLDRFDKID